MEDPVARLAPLARPKMDEATFRARVAEARQAFDDLLDEEAVALLVLDELGLNEGAFVTIDQLHGRTEASVKATLERVEPPREFFREGRPPGRVANAVVRDATGEARLTLWDADVERIEDGTLRPGAAVTLVNVRVKETRFGTELHVGPWTDLRVEGALDPARRKLLADVAVQEEAPARANVQARLPERLEGVLREVFPTRTYRRADGTTGFACDADVETPGGLLRLVAWDVHVKALRGLAPGARVVADPVQPRPRGAAVEWHTTPETRFEP